MCAVWLKFLCWEVATARYAGDSTAVLIPCIQPTAADHIDEVFAFAPPRSTSAAYGSLPIFRRVSEQWARACVARARSIARHAISPVL